MSEISTNLIKEAVYKLCFDANTCLNNSVYSKILDAYNKAENNTETKNLLKNILKNAEISYKTKLPLCQDTGQVIVFIETGQGITIKGEYLETAVNYAVEQCYKDSFFRKSVVKNAVFDRTNTKTNTPAVIYTKLIPEEEIRIKVLIKGAGSENKSRLVMLLPTSQEDDIIKTIGDNILLAAENACPPMFVGIGIAGTMDKSAVLSKKTFVNEKYTQNEKSLASKIAGYVNSKAPALYKNCYILDLKILTDYTHIACMPAAITINCHSDRYSTCTIKDNKILYNHKIPDFVDFPEEESNLKIINTNNTAEIRNLKQNEKILLSGEIYVARDMAHKRLIDLINSDKELPFDIKDKIIFYAGPCPAKPGQISGSIGPTTASRMDKYAEVLHKKGLLAAIGKGNRNSNTAEIIKETNSKYFTVQGGIAALIAGKINASEIIAFEDLGTEAIYKINVEKLPLKVEIA